MTSGSSKLRGGNVVHRIELPRRRWPARGRFAHGWPEGAPPLPTPLVTADLADVTLVPQEPRRTTPRRTQVERDERRDAIEAVLPRARVVRDKPRAKAAQAPPPGLDPARESAFRKEIEQLERRLRKMNGLLEDREDQLRKLVSNGRVDSGLASLYREVQGITDDSPMAETKRELMSSIFEANRKLQTRLRELEHGDGDERAGGTGAA